MNEKKSKIKNLAEEHWEENTTIMSLYNFHFGTSYLFDFVRFEIEDLCLRLERETTRERERAKEGTRLQKWAQRIIAGTSSVPQSASSPIAVSTPPPDGILFPSLPPRCLNPSPHFPHSSAFQNFKLFSFKTLFNPVMICNWQGSRTIGRNRARPGQVHSLPHQIPAWQFQHSPPLPHQWGRVHPYRRRFLRVHSGPGGW